MRRDRLLVVFAARAALRLGWPARAAFLAQRALELQDDAAAHVLAGEALEALRDLRAARTEYLRALDLEPDNRAALEGLRRVGGAPPPRPDLTGDRALDLDLDEVALAQRTDRPGDREGAVQLAAPASSGRLELEPIGGRHALS